MSKATLHNQFEVKNKGVMIGDTIVIRKAGEIILHAANPSASAREVTINLKGWKSGKPAHGQVLTSASPDDLNTLDNPGKVTPAEVSVPVSGGTIKHTLPAWSHTVLRVPR